MSELLKTAIAKAKYLRDGGQPLENLCNNGDLVVVLGNELESKEKELQALKEQLARMGEVLERYLESGCDLHHEHGIREALSSYDPKWIEGVRAEAKAEADAIAFQLVSAKLLSEETAVFCEWVSEMEQETRANLPSDFSENQSREKMG